MIICDRNHRKQIHLVLSRQLKPLLIISPSTACRAIYTGLYTLTTLPPIPSSSEKFYLYVALQIITLQCQQKTQYGILVEIGGKRGLGISGSCRELPWDHRGTSGWDQNQHRKEQNWKQRGVAFNTPIHPWNPRAFQLSEIICPCFINLSLLTFFHLQLTWFRTQSNADPKNISNAWGFLWEQPESQYLFEWWLSSVFGFKVSPRESERTNQNMNFICGSVFYDISPPSPGYCGFESPIFSVQSW